MRIASFDIGKKNFAFCIEEFDDEELRKLSSQVPSECYNDNGTPTPEMSELLAQVCGNGQVILFLNSDLTENCPAGAYLDIGMFHNLTELLDRYKDEWDLCSAFVVEQQMSFGQRKRNTMALKLGQHCQSYFLFQYGRFKEVIEFPAFHKTQVLGAPKVPGKKYKNGRTRWKGMPKPQRKKWAVTKAQEILDARGDETTMSKLTSKKKKDDLADVLVQAQAFKYLTFVAAPTNQS